MSLAAAPATTILPTAQPDAARTFYTEVLGLPFRGKDADGKLLFGLAAGSTLALIEKPAGSQADHTAISFEVADIGASIAELQARGVVFDARRWSTCACWGRRRRPGSRTPTATSSASTSSSAADSDAPAPSAVTPAAVPPTSSHRRGPETRLAAPPHRPRRRPESTREPRRDRGAPPRRRRRPCRRGTGSGSPRSHQRDQRSQLRTRGRPSGSGFPPVACEAELKNR
jgi:hypothetical protein